MTIIASLIGSRAFAFLKKNWLTILLVFLLLYFFTTLRSSILRFFGINEVPHYSDGGATISDVQANTFADQLQRAMGDLGTDEKTIYDVLSQLKNQADFNKVHNKFGARNYNFTTGTSGGIFGIGTKGTLTEQLSNELNSSEKEYIRTTYPHLKIL